MADRGSVRSLASIPGVTAAPVMVIDGAEDKMRDKLILNRFGRFAGGTGGHVVVISTASSLGHEATEAYMTWNSGTGTP